MENQIKEIRSKAEKELKEVNDLKSLNDIRVKFLGKQGELTSILRGMRDVEASDRQRIGSIVNDARAFIETEISSLQERLEEEELNKILEKEKIDITEPSKGDKRGCLHPLTDTFNKLIDTCVSMGFKVVTGPEIESDYYNFEALNIPKDHPARDMQDTFFIDENLILRSQTSSVQIRAMEKMKPPIKIVVPGRTYRSDSDATHTPVFHQLEGLVVDEEVSLVDLKATLKELLKIFFGEDIKIRFRPSYFPFTEPSVEVDISCPSCKGEGCKLCKKTGYIEVLGAGMVNRKVLENVNIDSKKYKGFAFGIGVDRMSMLVNHITDLRSCFENDKRFITQMKGGKN